MKDKVRLISLYLPTLEGGGAERAVVNVANYLVQSGYKVDLVLVKRVGPYLDEVRKEVNIIDLGSSRNFFSILKLRRYLCVQNPDVFFSAMRHVNVVALMARMFSSSDSRLIISERNWFSLKWLRKQGVSGCVIGFLMKKLYPNADKIISVSEGVKRNIIEELSVCAEDVEVVYNPVVTKKVFEDGNEKLQLESLTNCKVPVIATAGRLAMQKDFATLIEAFAILRNKREAKMVIMGEGELRDDLIGKIRKLGLDRDVVMLGFVENPFQVMKRADLFVLSSAWEGLPNVLIQAMACGTRVVSTDCPFGPYEILEGGKWGRLTPVGDARMMASAMNDALDESDDDTPDVFTRAMDFSEQKSMRKHLDVLVPGK